MATKTSAANISPLGAFQTAEASRALTNNENKASGFIGGAFVPGGLTPQSSQLSSKHPRWSKQVDCTTATEWSTLEEEGEMTEQRRIKQRLNGRVHDQQLTSHLAFVGVVR